MEREEVEEWGAVKRRMRRRKDGKKEEIEKKGNEGNGIIGNRKSGKGGKENGR